MFRRMKQFMRNCHGFSLVEAIISVAIVGIAMVPISMIFSQTTAQSIEMRKQLQANVLVQEYVENLKTRTPADFNQFFGAATSVSYSSSQLDTDFTSKGLKPLPKGYEVTLSYSKDAVNTPAFTLPSGQTPLPVDLIISLPSGKDETTIITKGDGTPLASHNVGTLMTNDRQILIRAGRTNGEYEIIYQKKNLTTVVGEVSLVTLPRSLNAIRFEMGNRDTNLMKTNIVVDSSATDHIKVHVYEDGNNTIQATTEVMSGLVTFNRNLSLPGAFTHGVIKITAEIKETVSGKILASVTTTKVDE